MRGPVVRVGWVSVAALTLLVLSPPRAGAESSRARVAGAAVAVVTDSNELFLEAPPLANEGWIRFTRRFCASDQARSEVEAYNGKATRLLRDGRYKVPFGLLHAKYQLAVMQALFVDDLVGSSGWRHYVRGAEGRTNESLWSISQWFTGSGENFSELRRLNALDDEFLAEGQEVLISPTLLRPSLAAALPSPTSASSEAGLEYGRDEGGQFAVYRLRAGEALYSSVVVRLTGRIHADDVNELVEGIAERSGISDVRTIPVGYRVKIPVDVLAPEFLPPAHPRRLEYEEGRSETARYTNRARSRDLAGVTVILDPGHGGRDVGASISGVWESVYVYDIALRVRRVLQDRSAAKVVLTTKDGAEFRVQEKDVLGTSRGHKVLTRPPYAISDSKVSSNLRWYLANSVLARAVEADRRADKVVFVSIHADSLHPSLRGAMVYVPGLLKNPSNYGKTGVVYSSRQEVKERPRVTFSRQQRVESEGLSRDLAGHLIDTFRENGLTIHANKPVRDRVIRANRAWVPAVLRFNAVPSKVLLEVCNLANAEDRRLIRTSSFREKVAAGVADAIISYYGVRQHHSEPPQVANLRK